MTVIIIIIKNECHSNIIVDRLRGCGKNKYHMRDIKTCVQLINGLFCCLWHNVEASCHKHFVAFSRNQHRRLLPVMCLNLRLASLDRRIVRYGPCSFAVAGPSPAPLRNGVLSAMSFRRQLKTELYIRAYKRVKSREISSENLLLSLTVGTKHSHCPVALSSCCFLLISVELGTDTSAWCCSTTTQVNTSSSQCQCRCRSSHPGC